MRKSPLAAIVRRVAWGCEAEGGAPGAGKPAAMSATAATIRSTTARLPCEPVSPAHVVPLHNASAGLELEPAGQLSCEGAERLPVVAAEEQAVRVVLTLAPRREAQVAHARQVRRERLWADLVRHTLHP